MEIEFAEVVQDSPDEPIHLNIWVGGICRSFLVEDVLAKMDAVEHTLAPDAACGHASSDNWKIDESGNMYCVLCRAGKA